MSLLPGFVVLPVSKSSYQVELDDRLTIEFVISVNDIVYFLGVSFLYF